MNVKILENIIVGKAFNFTFFLNLLHYIYNDAIFKDISEEMHIVKIQLVLIIVTAILVSQIWWLMRVVQIMMNVFFVSIVNKNY